MVMFRAPEHQNRFEDAYNDFLALVERMPHIKRRQVINVIGSPLGQSPYYRILEVYYEDQATLERSLNSPEGQEAGGELRRFPLGAFEMLFADVYEEEGGHTPR